MLRPVVQWCLLPRLRPLHLQSQVVAALSTTTEVKSDITTRASTKFWDVVQRYEDFIGNTEVREAQERVIHAEDEFTSSRSRRQEKQSELSDVNAGIREVHADLDKTHRSEDRYLDLLTKEHGLIKQQKGIDIDFKQLERVERDNFSVLSQRLRESHEKERARAERTKYWSVIGSAIGALIGIMGATINNRLRMQELRDLVKDSTDPGRIQAVLGNLTGFIESQQNQVRKFLSELKGIIQNGEPGSLQLLSLNALGNKSDLDSKSSDDLLKHFDSLATSLKVQDESMRSEMTELKSLLAADHASQDKAQIVYVGPQLEDILDRTQENLEYKMKINTLVAVAAVYGAIAVILPFIASALGGAGDATP